MLIECAPISVELRTSLATENERWNSWCSVVPSVPAPSASRTACFIWPRICGSPSTIESSPLATRKAWRAAAVFQHVGVRQRWVWPPTPPMPASHSTAGRTNVARSMASRPRTARCGCRWTAARLRAWHRSGAARKHCSAAGRCSGANANRPRRSSGAVRVVESEGEDTHRRIIKFWRARDRVRAPAPPGLCAISRLSIDAVLAPRQLASRLLLGPSGWLLSAALAKLLWRRDLDARGLVAALRLLRRGAARGRWRACWFSDVTAHGTYARDGARCAVSTVVGRAFATRALRPRVRRPRLGEQLAAQRVGQRLGDRTSIICPTRPRRADEVDDAIAFACGPSARSASLRDGPRPGCAAACRRATR